MKNSKKLCFLCLMCLVLLSACLKTEQKADEETGFVVETGDVSEKNDMKYVIQYYEDMESENPSEMTTEAVCGVDTNLLTTKELGFSRDGYSFRGWRIYRDIDEKWFAKNKDGKGEWVALSENGDLPEGFTFSLREDGGILHSPAESGVVKLYAQWGEQYKIEYYEDIYSLVPLEKTSIGAIGVDSKLLTLAELGLDEHEGEFAGWRLNREEDDKWFLRGEDGKSDWVSLEDGELPKGYEYALRSDGGSVYSPVSKGVLKLYAEWLDE